MKEIKQTKRHLEERRDEIKQQLNRVNQREEINLVNDMEDQAIQVEQHEVAVTMEENLQKELADIEDKLLEFDKE